MSRSKDLGEVQGEMPVCCSRSLSMEPSVSPTFSYLKELRARTTHQTQDHFTEAHPPIASIPVRLRLWKILSYHTLPITDSEGRKTGLWLISHARGTFCGFQLENFLL
jgi:hypothetical protein